jgi:hypothetical protein
LTLPPSAVRIKLSFHEAKMRTRRVILYAIPVLLGAFSVMSHAPDETPQQFVQNEEVVDEQPGPDDVTDEQLQTYIAVYSAMQLDHSLTLEDALTPHELTLEEFRSIERRVQTKSRLVAKVRDALLEQATQRSAFSEPRGGSAAAQPAEKKP